MIRPPGSAAPLPVPGAAPDDGDDGAPRGGRATGAAILVYGAGGHGRVVADAAVRAGLTVLGFLDDGVNRGTAVGPWRVLGDGANAPRPGGPLRPGAPDAGRPANLPGVIVAIGDNRARWGRVEELAAAGVTLSTVAHPSAQVSESAAVGAGVFIGPLAVVNAGARLGPGAVVNSGAIVEHDVRLGAGGHVAPGAVACGGARIGERALIGAGAVVLPRRRVGDDAIVGAGAVVTHDVEAGQTVVGPAARAR